MHKILNITVIGMGKIGLPLAVSFAKKGNKVIGLDSDLKRINQLSTLENISLEEPDLRTLIAESIKSKNISFTTNYQKAINSAHVVVVCIPLLTNLNNDIEYSNIDELVHQIGKNIGKGALLSFETTLPVGATRKFAQKIENFSGFEVGRDIFIIFSPERVSTGTFFRDLSAYPKLVGGVTEECTRQGIKFYESVIDFSERNDLSKQNGVWALKSAEAAEFTKIAETTYRDVNIALANEFSIYAHKYNIDIEEVIISANSQPFSHLHQPGISVGGHCIPIYPQFYLNDNPKSLVVKYSREINANMPKYTIERIKESIGPLENLAIGIFGVAYRSGVKEAAFSGAFILQNLLQKEFAKVFAFDPLYQDEELSNLGFKCVEDFNILDGIIIHTYSDHLNQINFSNFHNLKFIFDGRNKIEKHRINTDKILLLRI